MSLSLKTGQPVTRPSGRAYDALRSIELVTNVTKHAEGSCLAKFGDTHVLCTASIEEKVPHWLKGGGKGWVTAEYGMLPRATHTRVDREAAKGKQSGRTQEIQRLIGRAMRSIVDLSALGERQIKIDCDVLQADGGTRTASITGAYVALHLACQHLMKLKLLRAMPLRDSVAAISCGIYQRPVRSRPRLSGRFRSRHRRQFRHHRQGRTCRNSRHGGARTVQPGAVRRIDDAGPPGLRGR